MIYSKRLQTQIPVCVQKQSNYIRNYGMFTRYTVKDNKIPVGVVDIRDVKNGAEVLFIENKNPQLYSGFGKIADQIEVEHCLKRGLTNFEITSDAGLNSHALHYLRGKRFFSDKINKLVESIIASTPKGSRYFTKQLGKVPMYMPQDLIKKYIAAIKKQPLLK